MLEIIVILEQGAYRKLEIKRSGSHRATVKVTAPIAVLMSSIRSTQIDPQKGTQNPPHTHTKLPKGK